MLSIDRLAWTGKCNSLPSVSLHVYEWCTGKKQTWKGFEWSGAPFCREGIRTEWSSLLGVGGKKRLKVRKLSDLTALRVAVDDPWQPLSSCLILACPTMPLPQCCQQWCMSEKLLWLNPLPLLRLSGWEPLVPDPETPHSCVSFLDNILMGCTMPPTTCPVLYRAAVWRPVPAPEKPTNPKINKLILPKDKQMKYVMTVHDRQWIPKTLALCRKHLVARPFIV